LKIKIIQSHKQIKDLPVGWLLPNEFIKVKWGKHEEWAGEYILSDEKLIEEDEQFEEKYFSYLSKDFLIVMMVNCLFHIIQKLNLLLFKKILS
jgi:hypothetical protein